MKNLIFILSTLIGLLLLFCFSSCYGVEDYRVGNFYIGWASIDITPDKPVIINGGRPACVSEGELKLHNL